MQDKPFKNNFNNIQNENSTFINSTGLDQQLLDQSLEQYFSLYHEKNKELSSLHNQIINTLLQINQQLSDENKEFKNKNEQLTQQLQEKQEEIYALTSVQSFQTPYTYSPRHFPQTYQTQLNQEKFVTSPIKKTLKEKQNSCNPINIDERRKSHDLSERE